MLSDNLKTPIPDVDFAFLDVETTGLDPVRGDRVCEIAILKTKNNIVVDSFETLINPGIRIPPSSSAIHGIVDEMIEDSPYFLDVAEDVQRILKGCVIIAHNAQFDLKFVDMELNFTSDLSVKNVIIDTLGIARKFYSFPSNNLGEIAKSLGIPIYGYHRAMVDVQITKDVFEYFTRDLERRGIRVNLLKDLIRIQGGNIDLCRYTDKILPKIIENALINKERLQIKYLSPFNDLAKSRVIEPLDVVVNRSNTYIVAYCHMRKEKCTFRLDRILEVYSVN